MTPYLVPDETFLEILINKALSGADVRIVLPGIPDKAFVYQVTKNYAEKLLSCGVKIYYLRNSFVHSKLLLTDKCAVIGSANMDMRSFYQQYECGVHTNDLSTRQSVLTDFENTFADCLVVTERSQLKNGFLIRGIRLLLQIFAPLM